VPERIDTIKASRSCIATASRVPPLPCRCNQLEPQQSFYLHRDIADFPGLGPRRSEVYCRSKNYPSHFITRSGLDLLRASPGRSTSLIPITPPYTTSHFPLVSITAAQRRVYLVHAATFDLHNWRGSPDRTHDSPCGLTFPPSAFDA